MLRNLIQRISSGAIFAVLLASVSSAQSVTKATPQRLVLVELFTSQGCDMCPTAEKILGELGESNARVVPLAFHVDYFNNPWKDPFSDPIHSRRQAVYNSLYTKPKNPDYGLYYTPMVMVDGVQTVNGRDPEGIRAAVRTAQAKPPKVEITSELEVGGDLRSGELRIAVTPRVSFGGDKELLVCGVLRDDLVVTEVHSGENANKRLTARYPARITKHEYFTPLERKTSQVKFQYQVEPTWKTAHLGLVVFVQDRKTAEIYQASYVPWRNTVAKNTKGDGFK